MTMITCPSCGEETFTITGWTDVDHCANCGRPLTGAELEPADVDADRAEAGARGQAAAGDGLGSST